MSAAYLDYTQDQLDALLNARALAPDYEEYTDRFEERSEQTRRGGNCTLGIAYGQNPRERLDVFLPDGVQWPAVNLFFHGGYWRSSDKERYSFIADAFRAYGAAYIAVEYALIPSVTMDALVAQCRRAVAYVHQNSGQLGIDPDRIYVSGHSAGGQIVGLLLASGWQQQYGLAPDVIKGGCGISGLYDMEAIRLSYLNATLGLDPESARRTSAYRQRPSSGAALIAAVGGNEGEEFLRQNAVMVDAWKEAVPVTGMVLSGLHHYSAVESLGDPGSALGVAVRAQMEL